MLWPVTVHVPTCQAKGTVGSEEGKLLSQIGECFLLLELVEMYEL